MLNASNKKKTLNLVASILVTALVIVVWRLAEPGLSDITHFIKLVSYGILLFGMTWILDAIFCFYKAEKKATPLDSALSIQRARAVTGIFGYLMFSALCHPAVAVLFYDLERAHGFDMVGLGKFSLVMFGFVTFVSNSLGILGKRTWTGFAYAGVFGLGLLFTVLFPKVYIAIPTLTMAGLAIVISYIDLFTTCKKYETPAKKLAIRYSCILLIMIALLMLRHLTPIQMGNNVLQFAVSGGINAVLAVVVDIVLLIVLRGGKDKDKDQPAAPEAGVPSAGAQ